MQPVEHGAAARQRAVVVIEKGQGEQDAKSGHQEAEPCQQTAPPAGTGIANKDPDLNATRTWQGIDERKSLKKLSFGNPAAPFLDLRLDDAHRRSAVIQGTDLQESPHDLPPV